MTICRYPNCTVKNAIFNYRDKNGPYFCKKHKLPDMVDVKHIRCKFSDCNLRPTYGEDRYGEEKIPLYCKNHKLKDMIKIKYNVCKFPLCTTNSIFGRKGSTPTHCGTHKSKDMINLKDKHCALCSRRASYGIIGCKPTHCAKHANKENMIFRPNKRCVQFNCDAFACYGINQQLYHCSDHKQSDEILYIPKNCISCGNLNDRTECIQCFETKLYLKKEEILKELEILGITPTISERFEKILDFGNRIVILVCENDKTKLDQDIMLQTFQSFGILPVYFIYFSTNQPKHPIVNLVLNIRDETIDIPESFLSFIYCEKSVVFTKKDWRIIIPYTNFLIDEIDLT